MGDKMDYRVAMDKVPDGDVRGQNGAMAKNWMIAAGQNGIPTAFIVDRDSKIAWIGHPMEIEATPRRDTCSRTPVEKQWLAARRSRSFAPTSTRSL